MKNFQLPRFQAGQPLLNQLSADRMNAILEAIDRTTPIAGRNVQVKSVPGGKIISAKAEETGSQSSQIAFQVIDRSNDNDGLQVLVVDGKVNGDFPAGMGFGEYLLGLAEETFQEVILIITYDEETLEFTSLTLGLTDDPPDSESGTIIVPIADIIITYDDESNPIVTITQLWTGDINLQLIYGALDGLPALYPLAAIADPIPIPEDG